MNLRRRLMSSGGFLLALFLVIAAVFYSTITTAQSSFVGSLPPGYAISSGQLIMGKSCSCATGAITGAPPLPPPCGTNRCFGNSYTRYGVISTNSEAVKSTTCDEVKQATGRNLPPCFQLDGDDAVVIIGSMSPVQNLAYYSYTLYQNLTYNSQSATNYTFIESSVGTTPNISNFKLGLNGKYALIMTASTKTLNIIKRALRTTGVPDSIMNTYLIPTNVTNVGKVNYPDQLSLQLRLTYQSAQESQQIINFVQQTAPETKVLFIKAPGTHGDITFDDIPKWEDTLRANDIEYRTGLDQRLALLEKSVTNTYLRRGFTLKARLTQSLRHVDTNECRESLTDCAFDSPDALYSSFPCDFSPTELSSGNCNIQLGLNNEDVLMLIGVDHTLVGDKTLAAYFSQESKAIPGSKDGTFSFMGLHTQNSAKQYWPRTKGDNLYAVKIARYCGPAPFCSAVPYQRYAPDQPRFYPDQDTGFYIVGRIYLDKATGSGPNPANLIPAILLWFTKS